MNVTNNDMKQYAKPAGEHVPLGSTLRGVIFVIPAAVAALIFFSLASSGALPPPVAIGAFIVVAFLWYVVVSGIRVAAQWERGVVLFLGKFRCA